MGVPIRAARADGLRIGRRHVRRESGPTAASLIPPFAYVTSAAGFVIVISGLVDAATSAGGGLGSLWTWLWTLVAAVVSALPVAFGARFPRWVGLAGTLVFFAVTALQMAVSTAPILSVNNLVLYPMFACYLGWFYRPFVSRLAVGFAFGASGIALAVNPFDAVQITWVNLALASLFCREAAGYLRAKLDREITTDPLTGVLNRSGLDARLDLELARGTRTGQPMTVAILDLDDFKRLNDEHGHAEGDRVLVAFAGCLRRNTRPYDSVVRLGGDEFLLLMTSTTVEQAREMLARISAPGGLDWSSGLAEARPGDDAHSIRERADQELYAEKRRKRSGRMGVSGG
ncbi:diguanylate cyclase [Cryobacterium sp. MDB1-18-2]|nr:diguanylate cyclase [Cryobacterium sp. MDB2-A-1]TFC08408.1 diguanylate cyclase [Cryobacterium sp. MDB2-33-2]TFC08674.1 diguanylate cyclase [Cryobacterium sp. MDB2-A-2]TFC22270.1 diguanylate cyclase [Cryobacterium sp. MDB2-10]TFC30133.1 diguanylate cyclase [Cryobacterium sp. MDB1-18-2]TFC41413.1 diguanylate cyclase [Cryobacterium sp. MDB1-18-1]